MISGPVGRVWLPMLLACLCVAGLQVGLVLVHPDRPRRTVEVASDGPRSTLDVASDALRTTMDVASDALRTPMDVASDVRGLPGVTSVVLPQRNLTSAHRRQ